MARKCRKTGKAWLQWVVWEPSVKVFQVLSPQETEGSVFFVISILDALAGRIDRVIGATALKPSLQAQLLSEQIRALVQMTPAMTFGAGFIALLLLGC